MKKTTRKFGRSVFAICGSVLLMLSFQNCSNGFSPAQFVIENSTKGSGTDVTPTPSDESTPTPTPTATPTPTPSQEKVSYVYVGATSKIKSFRLNHETDAVVELPEIALSGQSPGWFAFDAAASRVFVADAQGGNLNSFAFDVNSGALALENTVPFLKGSVHLSLQKTATGYFAQGASYGDAKFARYEISADGSASSAKNIMDYSAGAKSHSSSFDADRKLVFVSNLGQGRVVVYKDNDGDLSLLTSISVVNPRIVHYDPTFDKLYIITEAYSGNSFVKIYSISNSQQNGYDFTEVASHTMALSGGDLKIDHTNGYIGATVREEGKQGVWVLPVTSAGLFDSAREKVFIPMEEFAPRSLQISSDGRYYVVACDSSKNTNDLVIFKMSYDSASKLMTSAVLKKIDLGTGSFLSNFLL